MAAFIQKHIRVSSQVKQNNNKTIPVPFAHQLLAPLAENTLLFKNRYIPTPARAHTRTHAHTHTRTRAHTPGHGGLVVLGTRSSFRQQFRVAVVTR